MIKHQESITLFTWSSLRPVARTVGDSTILEITKSRLFDFINVYFQDGSTCAHIAAAKGILDDETYVT